ncbi:hypothetical protein D3C72_1892510 [compost metagenome]
MAGIGLHPHEGAQLPREDDDRDAVGEADDHRVGEEGDELAHVEQAEPNLHEAGEDAGDPDLLDAVLANEPDQNDGHGSRGAGDLNGGTSEEGGNDARDDGRV